ncbi:MAG: glycosyltransferase family 2 protein [Flavobacteriaceae bacterium]|nr:glycosyltransferase family 2 protein [Flavobacteriaceae bacterium]
MNIASNIQLSVIVAVYQRRIELIELLTSLGRQNCKDFEVIIIDDGSPFPLGEYIGHFAHQLDIHYYYKNNSGPGQSRNYGMHKAKGNYFVFLDSDVIVPENYICEVLTELNDNYVDFFGGSDAAHESFDELQKAINFSMTSMITTGGIRGGKRKIDKFQPRSFNMGISREAYEATGGFGPLRVGEDPDLSMTLWEKGFKSRWFPRAFVYHKRRTDIEKFQQQVYNFGIARPILNQRHPAHRSLTFWFPSLFFLAEVVSLFLFIFYNNYIGIILFVIYFLVVFIFSSLQNKSMQIGLLSVLTTSIQFMYYGLGFLISQIKLHIFQQKPEKAFPSHFSKKADSQIHFDV